MFPENVQKYFNTWINQDGWNSEHPLDQQRFYRFVKACKPHGKKKISYHDVKNAIIEKVLSISPDFDKDTLEELANNFAGRYSMFMDYEDVSFP
jgi:hypothetical protein